MTTSHRITFITFFCLAFFFQARGQDSVKVNGTASAEVILHNGELPPLWSVALQEGRWNNLAGSQTLVTAAAGISGDFKNDWTLSAGVEMDYATGYGDAFLHSGWGEIQWKSWSLKGGKHLFDPVFTESNMGTGSYLFGTNFRPVPRVTFELSEYTPIPFTNGFAEVRGGISQAWLTDQPLSGDVLLHEKYAYLRINPGRWNLYGGLNHSTLFGGQRNGVDIPIDFWPTFFGKGSDKIGGGEATNAAGAHMGMYDFGTRLETQHGYINIYYQIPFSDGSGMLFWQGNSDHIFGVDWHPTETSWLTNLTFEWFQTTYQSGNGTPDPYLNGIIFPKQVEDKNGFVEENFGIVPDHPLSLDEFKDILEDELNHGNDFGGRDGYMNNGMYPAGWSREGHIMGSPLNMTRAQMLAIRSGMEFNDRVEIINDRFSGLHLGGRGQLNEALSWKMKITWSRNFGTYYEQYEGGRYNWNEKADYWFKGGRDQWYTMAGISWAPSKIEGLSAGVDLFYDGGDIYHSFGVKTAVTFRLF
ncbi:capsule assembly Wzi family protein [Marinilabilia sp.]|uniref:capsule assembly Wzi family protein n=1 Tax=Marinilabilia sp. TaxID=2021252 RepID=UPI0025C434CE|nr:capsule assembly Wzi family protein [Marinilabilia sp.]